MALLLMALMCLTANIIVAFFVLYLRFSSSFSSFELSIVTGILVVVLLVSIIIDVICFKKLFDLEEYFQL